MIAAATAAMATSAPSLPVLSYDTHSPFEKLNRHSYLRKLYFTKKSNPSSCKSFSVGDPSSSYFPSASPCSFLSASDKNISEPMVPPYNVLITGSSKGVFV